MYFRHIVPHPTAGWCCLCCKTTVPRCLVACWQYCDNKGNHCRCSKQFAIYALACSVFPHILSDSDELVRRITLIEVPEINVINAVVAICKWLQ